MFELVGSWRRGSVAAVRPRLAGYGLERREVARSRCIQPLQLASAAVLGLVVIRSRPGLQCSSRKGVAVNGLREVGGCICSRES